MSEQINVGDLVMIVRVHCNLAVLGHLFTVTRIIIDDNYCAHCKTTHTFKAAIASGFFDSWFPLDWLRKINPPTIPETIEHDEEITA